MKTMWYDWKLPKNHRMDSDASHIFRVAEHALSTDEDHVVWNLEIKICLEVKVLFLKNQL